MSKKPTVLMILDGYGLRDDDHGNAVAEAATPVMDKLMAEGMDHHFVLKEGDYTKEMAAFCDYMGFEKVIL